MTLSDLSNSTTISLAIIPPVNHKNVRYNTQEVKITIPVEKYTEAIINIPVKAMAGNPGIKIKTFPEEITVTYLVALKDFNKIDQNMFKVSANPGPLMHNSPRILKVKLIQYPPFVKITKIEPEMVEYVILKDD